MSRASQVPSTAKAAAPIVFVVDDEPSVRQALSGLFRSVGLQVELFGSAAEFLQRKQSDSASCLVLDIRLPGVSGLDFQGQLLRANIRTPIIFMTGHGDIPMSVRAMKACWMPWPPPSSATSKPGRRTMPCRRCARPTIC